MKTLILLSLVAINSFACTTFQLRGAEHVYYGRNYDWDETHGALIFNTRGLKKTAVASQNQAVWTSKLASLTFNQPGLDFPQGGINEKGLVIEVMIGPMETDKNSNLKRINELQWVQRLLDLAETTEEAMKLASEVVIEKIVVDLHYLVCDRERNCATVDHINGLPVIHNTVQYPILTNAAYSDMLSYLKGYEGFGGKAKIPSGYSSHARFARVADALKKYTTAEPFEFIFKTLDDVSNSAAWQIAYDQTVNKIMFRVQGVDVMHEVEFPEVSSYSCASTGLKAVNLEDENMDLSFTPYTIQWNNNLVDQTAHATSAMKQMLKNYPSTVECTDALNLGTL